MPRLQLQLQLLHQIPLSWYLFLSILSLGAFLTFGLPRIRTWKAALDRRRQAKRFERIQAEADAEDDSSKKKRKQASGERELTPASTSTATSSALKSPRRLNAPLTPTPAAKKTRPRAPSHLGAAPAPASASALASTSRKHPPSPSPSPASKDAPTIDTSDFEPVKAKHKLKALRRLSNASPSTSKLQVPERSGGESSSAASTTSAGSEDERRLAAEIDTTIANLRVEIGVAKAQEGKARSEAEKAREMEVELCERVERMTIEKDAREREAARRESELQSRLHALSSQYQTLCQRHAALEAAFHNLASGVHGTPLPSPHLSQGQIPVYPIAIPMPSPIPLRHSSGSYYGHAYPSSPSASHFYAPPPPPQLRRTSGNMLAGPLTPGTGSMNPYPLSPVPGGAGADHELKKNVQSSVLKRNPDRTKSESEESSSSARAGSDAEAGAGADADAPIHGLGMGPLDPPEPEPELEPAEDVEAFPPVFPCVSHTREQLAELAKLQKSASERRASASRDREMKTAHERAHEMPPTPSPSASPSLKGASMVDLSAGMDI